MLNQIVYNVYICVYADREGGICGGHFQTLAGVGGIQECYFFDNSFVHYSSNTVDHARNPDRARSDLGWVTAICYRSDSTIKDIFIDHYANKHYVHFQTKYGDEMRHLMSSWRVLKFIFYLFTVKIFVLTKFDFFFILYRYCKKLIWKTYQSKVCERLYFMRLNNCSLKE